MASAQDKVDRRSQVMIGELPPDFLRVSSTPEQRQIAVDRQQAAVMQAGGMPVYAPTASRLSITIVQAKLNKNYGLTKMDPYCRIRVGHSVFETHTCPSGGKSPIWNKVIHAAVPSGVDSIYLEIFDERSFTMDDRVAWTHINIPARVLTAGETVDDWYPLNGKLGDGQEGSINLVLTYNRMPTLPVQRVVYASQPVAPMYAAPMYAPAQPMMVVPGGVAPVPMYYGYQPQPGMPAGQPAPMQQPAAVHRAGPAFTEEDVSMVKDMFPNIDVDVVRSVLEANQGDKDATINNLLAMESS